MATPKQSIKSKTYEKLKNKEYSKSYLNRKLDRIEEPNNYPVTKLVLIKDFFKTRDLYKAIGFFFSSQIALVLIAAGAKHIKMAGIMNLLAILIGLMAIFFAVREINNRQRNDNTRRRFRMKRVLTTLVIMLAAVYSFSYILHVLGAPITEQPNQLSLDELSKKFPVAMLFTMIFVSPIVEEIVFRELLPYATGPSYLSFIISSVMFVALHVPTGLIGWVSYSVLATGFLYARLKDNNVYSGIATHIIWNALSIFM